MAVQFLHPWQHQPLSRVDSGARRGRGFGASAGCEPMKVR